MDNPAAVPEPPPVTPPAPARRRWGCLAQVLVGCGIVLLMFVLLMWPFANRRHRADDFGNYVKEGFTVRQVFAGPRAWDFLWVNCLAADQTTKDVFIAHREDRYEVRESGSDEVAVFSDFDAVVEAMAAGKGSFKGLRSIHLAYRFYMASGTYTLTLGPDGRVVKIERTSRG
jgi:hypothetical protein